MGDLWDAIVVGLGPAGASAAALLAQRGLRVLALEREPGKRKACGGCLTEKLEGYLPPGWRSVAETTVYNTELVAGEIRVERRSERPVGFLVDRKSFDEFLGEWAREKGAETLTASVAQVYEDGGVVNVCTSRKVHAARYVVGAGGANCPCARFVAGSRPRANVVGLAAEAALPGGVPPGSIRLVLGLTGYGYGWFFSREGVLNLGLTERRGAAKRLYPAFEKLMGSEVPPDSLRWLKARQIPCYDGKRRLFKGKVALAGDAAGLVDPLSGEGISYAVASGTRAGAAVAEALGGGQSSLAAYSEWVKRRLYPDLRTARLLAGMIFRLPYRFAALMKANPGLLGYYIDVLRGLKSYRGFTAEVLKATGTTLARRLSRMAA